MDRVTTRHGARRRCQLSEFVEQLVESHNRLLLTAIPYPLTRPVNRIESSAKSLRPLARRNNAITQSLYCSGDLSTQLLRAFRNRRGSRIQQCVPFASIDAHLTTFAQPQVHARTHASAGRIPVGRPQPFADFVELPTGTAEP